MKSRNRLGLSDMIDDRNVQNYDFVVASRGHLNEFGTTRQYRDRVIVIAYSVTSLSGEYFFVYIPLASFANMNCVSLVEMHVFFFFVLLKRPLCATFQLSRNSK